LLKGVARKRQTKRDRNLAETVAHRYFDMADQRVPRVEAWDDSYEDHDPGYIDPKISRPPRVKFPYLFRVTTVQTSNLMKAMDANGRWLNVQPTIPELRHAVEPVMQFLEAQYRKKAPNLHDNNRDNLRRGANMGLKYGNGGILVQPDLQRGGGVRYINVDPYDTFLDASHNRFTVIRRIVTLSELRHLVAGYSAPINEQGESRDGGKAELALKQIEREIRAGNIGSYLYEPTASEHGNSRRFRTNRVQGDMEFDSSRVSSDMDPFNAPLVILEYYENDGDGMIAKIIPGFGKDGESLVLQSEPNPYELSPFVPFIPHQIDNEVYGIGNGEIVGKLAKAMDWSLRGTLAVIGAHGWPALLYAKSENLRRQHVKSVYGQAIEMRNPENLRFMQPIPTAGLHELARGVAQQAADFGTGESDVRRGDVGQARNATAAAIAETAGNATDQAVFDKWKDTIEQIGQVTLAMGRVHVTRPQLLPVLGRQASSFFELRPEFLQGDWIVSFGGNPRGANTSQQIQTLLNFAQSFAVTQEVDMREVAREILYIGGEREPDRFLTRKDPIPVMSPQDEEESLLQWAAHPRVSEQENKLEHLQQHQGTLQTWQQQMPPDDPRLAVLTQHFQFTFSLWQQEQAALQGGPGGQGASPGGPDSFQPGQVGSPGQPATFQGATAGINQVRNGSNVTAAGQAPGPTGSVPGRTVGQISTGSDRR
jgi:hypothetical protein